MIRAQAMTKQEEGTLFYCRRVGLRPRTDCLRKHCRNGSERTMLSNQSDRSYQFWNTGLREVTLVTAAKKLSILLIVLPCPVLSREGRPPHR